MAPRFGDNAAAQPRSRKNIRAAGAAADEFVRHGRMDAISPVRTARPADDYKLRYDGRVPPIQRFLGPIDPSGLRVSIPPVSPVPIPPRAAGSYTRRSDATFLPREYDRTAVDRTEMVRSLSPRAPLLIQTNAPFDRYTFFERNRSSEPWPIRSPLRLRLVGAGAAFPMKRRFSAPISNRRISCNEAASSVPFRGSRLGPAAVRLRWPRYSDYARRHNDQRVR